MFTLHLKYIFFINKTTSNLEAFTYICFIDIDSCCLLLKYSSVQNKKRLIYNVLSYFQYIRDHYGEDPAHYNKSCTELESLRQVRDKNCIKSIVQYILINPYLIINMHRFNHKYCHVFCC